MKWEVTGADRKTGLERTLLVESRDENSASAVASNNGLLVSRVLAHQEREKPATTVMAEADTGLSAIWWSVIIATPIIAISVGAWWILKPASVPASAVASPIKQTPPSPPQLKPVLTEPRSDQVNPAQEAAEIAALCAENKRLRKDRESATAPPPATLQTASITGSAWLSKNGGESDLLRGLHVQILAMHADPQAVGDSLREEAIAFDQAADEQDEFSKGFREDDEYGKKVVLEYKTQAKQYRDVAAFMRVSAGKIRPNITLDDAYKVLVAAARFGSPSFKRVALAATVLDVKADVNGKYQLSQVPSGHYYLHALLDTKSFYAEWLIPIVVTPDADMKIDLDNDNAVLIKN